MDDTTKLIILLGALYFLPVIVITALEYCELEKGATVKDLADHFTTGDVITTFTPFLNIVVACLLVGFRIALLFAEKTKNIWKTIGKIRIK